MIGNKAKNLQLLNQAGFNVKPMIVIDTDEVSEILKQAKVSSELLGRIHEQLDFRHGVAVRSSGTDEDGDLSWAGQFKTILWVNEQNLEASILQCAQACTCSQIRTYASVHGVEMPKLALIVQEMVDAANSGVTFTTNPVRNSGEMVIESIPGVAENLVSGTRQPNRYCVEFVSGRITANEVNESNGHLSQQHIERVYLACKNIHDFFGNPQDIEWAIEKETDCLYILQSRKITVSSEISQTDVETTRAKVIANTETHIRTEASRLTQLGIPVFSDVLSDQNIAEILTSYPCHMAFGLFVYLFAHGYGAIRVGRNEMGYDIGQELEKGFFALVGGQPRCSIVHDAFTYRVKGIPLTDYCKLVSYYLQQIDMDQQMANYPEVVLYQQQPSLEFLESLFGEQCGRKYYGVYQHFFENFRDIEMRLFQQCCDEFLPMWRSLIDDSQNEIRKAEDLSSLTSLYDSVLESLRTDACKMFVKVARVGFFAYARLRALLQSLFGEDGENYAAVLTSGIPFEMNPNLHFSHELYQLKLGNTLLESVVEDFGHLGIHELEISYPRYRDQQDMLISLANQIQADPREESAKAQMRYQELKRELMQQAGLNAELLDREISVARQYLPLREVVKFEYLKGYVLLREIAVKLNSLLGWEDGLIFYLLPEEVVILQQGVDNFANLARKRRLQREMERTVYVPPVIKATALESIGNVSSSDDSILKGVGVTNCIIEGVAVVVHDTQDVEAIAQLKTGDILVTATTDPAWSPILSIIGSEGGLVTEVGGLLAHGAIYAREVGMAAVLNVPRATSLIQTGMRVRVNGCQGYVEILN